MTIYSVVLTVVVLLAVAVLILLFERKRAREIEHDTREMAMHHEQEEGRRGRRTNRG